MWSNLTVTNQFLATKQTLFQCDCQFPYCQPPQKTLDLTLATLLAESPVLLKVDGALVSHAVTAVTVAAVGVHEFLGLKC